ncbi:serine/threonine protein kinase [Corallococcus interemptor]|uniref:Serine/threonine protein kinase n=2 Tax=Corallococcus TaxID=83461 RepID=A0A3A8Q8N8_9BACT|nr:serine/threonine-protein kinase [Corallococcus interemptor]RKH59634.1 serine/threonine protein kinase [Corallococcus interemptor]
MALQAGDVFGRYELVSWLGRGGMAETWRAQLVGDAGVTKPVLIKKVLPEYANDEAFISMFISEARISATLSHGNVAQVFDFGRVDGEYFLAMEFVDGQPLHRVLKRAAKQGMNALPIPVAVFIAMEMCRGLHYAHTRTDSSGRPLGIVHRDISPDNVLVGYEGQVKIVDFGIAKAQLLRGFKTAPGVVKGKYLFFSPEQARGEEVDARTDVWATGVVLYELLCGRLPVEGPPPAVMMRIARGEFAAPKVLRPDLPDALNELLLRALAPARDMRFESSHEFGDALAGYLYSNFPRFSAMTVAHLLRFLFKAELSQEGRKLPVPRSFLEEMSAWRTPLSISAPRAQRSQSIETTPSNPEAPTPIQGMPRPVLYPLALAVLVGLGASWWLLANANAPEVHLGPLPDTNVLRRVQEVPPAPPEATPPPPATPRPTEGAENSKPVTVGDYLAKIRGFIGQQDFNTAKVLANDCVVQHPDAPQCRLFLSVIEARFRNLQASAEHYEAFVRLSPEGDPNRTRAIELLYSSDFDPDPFDVVLLLGQLTEESPGIASQASAASGRSDRDWSRLFSKRAAEYAKRGKYYEALGPARMCVLLTPQNADCHLILGDSYQRISKRKQSRDHYLLFLSLAPEPHPARGRVSAIIK